MCQPPRLDGTVSHETVWNDLRVLASDDMEGRRSNSSGGEKAANFLVQRFSELQLGHLPRYKSYRAAFVHQSGLSKIPGTNIMGWVKGNVYPDLYIVVTAHYDHLGRKGTAIYNGADDNASGVAALLALAQQVTSHGSNHSIIFLATDAEEKGLYGAKAFVDSPPVPLNSIRFNLNMDMLAQGGRRARLFVSGSKRFEELVPVVERVTETAGICLKIGHSETRLRKRGIAHTHWLSASDHAVFYRKNIPFLYLGVATHADYHRATDTIDKIPKVFYLAAVETSVKILKAMDATIPPQRMKDQDSEDKRVAVN